MEIKLKKERSKTKSKKDKKIVINLGYKRFRKKIKRKKNKEKGRNIEVTSDYKLRQLSLKSYSNFIQFISKNSNKNKELSNDLPVPKNLSFVLDFDKSIVFFKDLHSSLYHTKDNININFEKCKHLSISTTTYLQIMLIQFYNFKKKYNENNYSKLKKNIGITQSKIVAVNKMLYALNIIESLNIDKNANKSSYLSMGLKTISKLRINYRENKKGKTCAEVNRFVNNSIKGIGYEFDPIGINLMDNLISEILGNAEDHSFLNQYYINGVSFKEDSIIELNLAIINFGDSIYEGFIKTKEKNKNVNEQMENLFNIHLKSINRNDKNHYTKESLFTLYALQEGISRIKFEKESRGNGTMNFIRAFIDLGIFGEENKKYESKLNIISGHTVIECTNKYKPFCNQSIYQLSLNSEKNIQILPNKKCIFVNEEYFPGTILQVKIFMSEKYFMKIVENDR